MAEHIEKVTLPDIGGAKGVSIIEVLVKKGDRVNANDSIITLEGDKATMEVPSPADGVVENINVKVGDKISEGDLILELKVADTEKKSEKKPEGKGAAADKSSEAAEQSRQTATEGAARAVESKKGATINKEEVKEQESKSKAENGEIHAGPSARRLAREVNIDLRQINGTGEKGRITKEDVQQFIQNKMAGGGSGLGFNLSPVPQVDFNKFGATETKPLSKIQKFSGAALHRNWISIPHITQFGEADITELEEFRQQQKDLAKQSEINLTPLVFIMKAVVVALKKFPEFNASLDPSGQHIILKKYFHIGVAVDTPNGLVVPVIRDVDQKGLFDLAKELMVISKKARETGLSLIDMQGGSFSISSLGGIGGTAFTPIINAPEVAILGVSRSEMKPIYQKDDEQFKPRLMLPLSLSYDHRVIDGALGARFMVYLSECLSDIRSLLLL